MSGGADHIVRDAAVDHLGGTLRPGEQGAQLTRNADRLLADHEPRSALTIEPGIRPDLSGRAVVRTGGELNTSVLLKQGIQARGLKILARDAREMAQRAGISSTDYFCGIAQTGVLTRKGVERLLETLPDGTTELMCHPGYVDEDLRKTNTRLQGSRQTELEILTDTSVRKLVAMRGIRLINYGFLAQAA